MLSFSIFLAIENLLQLLDFSLELFVFTEPPLNFTFLISDLIVQRVSLRFKVLLCYPKSIVLFAQEVNLVTVLVQSVLNLSSFSSEVVLDSL